MVHFCAGNLQRHSTETEKMKLQNVFQDSNDFRRPWKRMQLCILQEKRGRFPLIYSFSVLFTKCKFVVFTCQYIKVYGVVLWLNIFAGLLFFHFVKSRKVFYARQNIGYFVLLYWPYESLRFKRIHSFGFVLMALNSGYSITRELDIVVTTLCRKLFRYFLF